MSLENAVNGIFSVKSDVFSFGVLLLEIVSCKRNRRFVHQDHNLNLLGHAWNLYKEDKSLELIDHELQLADSCNVSQVLRSIQVGLLCVQQRREHRPNMSSVVLMLSNESPLQEAKEPGAPTPFAPLVTRTHNLRVGSEGCLPSEQLSLVKERYLMQQNQDHR
ncbi:hypothetical protein KY289_021620 [Solanum tuberosum]|nr:hypothetical protein KY284_021399 [Solanum tuberosum]KAH0683868.1 hypothetical protein KY289_021620 [Solanum tuberosum]